MGSYYKFSTDSNSEKMFENWSIFDDVKRYEKCDIFGPPCSY